MSIYYEKVEEAYNNNELYELLISDEKYNGVDEFDKRRRILSPEPRLMCAMPEELSPIDLEAVLSAIESFYCKNKRGAIEKDEFKDLLVETIEKMCNSNDIIQIYFAGHLYLILADRTSEDEFYPLEGLSERIKDDVNCTIEKYKDDLKNTKIYEGTRDGLFSYLVFLNSRIDENFRLPVLNENE